MSAVQQGTANVNGIQQTASQHFNIIDQFKNKRCTAMQNKVIDSNNNNLINIEYFNTIYIKVSGNIKLQLWEGILRVWQNYDWE